MKTTDPESKSAAYKGCTRIKAALTIPINRLTPDPNQPRKALDPESLERLAQSLKDKGQLLPIRARWDDDLGRWVIISGERRYRAAKLAGLSAVQCIECAVPISEDDVLEEQLIENRHQDDLKPIEQARAFRTLMDRRGWSARQLARALYLSESSVSRALALLELPDEVGAQVERGALPASVASEIAKLTDPMKQRELAQRVVDEGLNRAQTVAAVRETAGKPPRVRKDRGGRGAVVERTFSRGPVSVTVKLEAGADARAFLALLDEIRADVVGLFGARDETQAA